MSNIYLTLKIHTWKRDSHILFDYEAKNNKKSSLKITSSCTLFRETNQCFINEQEDINQSLSLLSITRFGNSFEIKQIGSSSHTQLWKVTKYCHKGLYELKENDIIKLGREILIVKKISNELPQNRQTALVPDTSEEKICRVCCYEEIKSEDPLISLCSCSGSVKYIHYSCLKNWLRSKVISESLGNVSTYTWSDLKCDLCKESLPEQFEYKGKVLSLIEIEYPNSPYIVLESLKGDEDQQVLYVVGLEENQSISIGRGSDSEIRLNDVSVSRLHARVRFVKNKFYLADNKSKFGTLTSVNDSILLDCSQSEVLQVNKSLVFMRVEKDWMCCGGNKIQP